MRRLPLEGIRIVEFGWAIAGPFASKILADYGAEVIKVESSLAADGPQRPANTGPHSVWYWTNRIRSRVEWNRGKRDVTINLRTEKGREVAKRIIALSDVVVDNYSVGVMERLGLGYASLRAIKPDIIMVDIQGFGTTGPHRHYVSYGPTIMAFAGMTYLWNHPNPPEPVGSQTAHPDYIAAEHAAFLILAALHYRDGTGKGQHLDLSQIETTASLLGAGYADYLVNGREQPAVGNLHPYRVPHNIYRCKGEDRWCAIAVTNDAEWRRLCQALGRPEWLTDPRFATLVARLRHREELDSLIEEWTRERTPQEVMEHLQEARVLAGMVMNGKDLFEDRHLWERGFMVELAHPVMEKPVIYPGLPVRLAKTPGAVRAASPLLGQDNDYVFRQLRGMSEEEIKGLMQEGVLV